MTFKRLELGIKIASLAAESRIIRRKELSLGAKSHKGEAYALMKRQGWTPGQDAPDELAEQVKGRVVPALEAMGKQGPVGMSEVFSAVERITAKTVRKFIRAGLTKDEILALPGVQRALSLRRAQATLSRHRTLIVRHESRHSQLAQAFLRGKAYRATEDCSRSYPNWDRIADIAARFSLEDRRIVMQRFERWSQEAQQFIRGRELMNKAQYRKEAQLAA